MYKNRADVLISPRKIQMQRSVTTILRDEKSESNLETFIFQV